MQGKQPEGGRKRSRTDAPVRQTPPSHLTDSTPLPHKRDYYLDSIWGDQMRQMCTEYDNQVHIARVPSAYQALIAPPEPSVYVRKRGKHVRFDSMPNAIPASPSAATSFVNKAQSLWRQFSGAPEDTASLLPK